MDDLMNSITDFCRREYGEAVADSVRFADPSAIPLGCTNVEDHEEILIEVFVDAVHACLDMYIDGVREDTWNYDSLSTLANEIDRISFDELMSLGPNSERAVAKLTDENEEE